MPDEKKSLQELFPRRYDIPVLIIACVALLYTALSLPLFQVEKMVLWKTEYSVMSGVVELFKQEEYLLSAILFFFSIVFPTFKLAMLWILWKFRFDGEGRKRVLEYLGVLGRWSMLDVFVVAILIVAVKLGPLANVEPKLGIYVFTAAILAAILTTAWVEKLARKALLSTQP